MGGYGSGSHRYRGANKCEAVCRIEIPYLNKHGLLEPGTMTTLTWSRRGQKTAAVELATWPEWMMLYYCIRQEENTLRKVSQRIDFDWTDTAFSGRRRWFKCPCCSRRCSVLYLLGGVFACRECQGLVYCTQYEDTFQRRVSRALKIKEKLGDQSGIGGIFPEKSKRMQYSTYERLRSEHEQTQKVFDRYLSAAIL